MGKKYRGVTLPTEIKILDQSFKVEYVASYDEVQDGESNEGIYLSELGIIRVALREHTPERVWNVIWHEALHAVWDCLGFKEEKEFKEEATVTKFATAINSICWDNKLCFLKQKGKKKNDSKTGKGKTKTNMGHADPDNRSQWDSDSSGLAREDRSAGGGPVQRR